MSDNTYTQIVNTQTAGDFVHTQQGTAKDEGFSNVSQFWFPKTISFDEAIEKLEAERKSRRDIMSEWSEWNFVVDEGKLSLQNGDGEIFIPTEHALMLASNYCEVSNGFLKQTLAPEFEADETDMQQLVDMLNYRKQRHHQTNKNEPRQLLFRTYGNTLRAVVTDQYATIDNRWFLETLRDLIPGGRLSHQRGDADTIYCNILLPDNVRQEEDSQYGGMFSVKNSEIRLSSIDTRPSLFRAICMNGCIWGEEKGVSYRQVHKGKIDLKNLAKEIGENLDGQIKLLPSIMDNFLKLREHEFKDVPMKSVFAQVALDAKMNREQITGMLEQWIEKEKQATAFGVVNAITRMSQTQTPAIGNAFDIYAGSLMSANWETIIAKAKALTAADLDKVFEPKKSKTVSA